MKEKVWSISPAVPIPNALIQAGCTPLVAAILAARGITTAEEAAAFLDDGVCPLEDPMLLTDMQAAVRRIVLARERGETAAVYGDYDVDGITAACLLTEYLRGTGLRTLLYIPDRLEEGYGLNTAAVDRLRAQGVTLIITVDCGITAVEETDYAARLGVDMVITDHHECQARLPQAVAVVDPKRLDCAYPNRDLAGVGVAFKLACALEGDGQKILDRYAELVAVGTIADVMPLVGENRRIVRAGLEALRTRPRPGLAALIRQTGVEREHLGAMSVGFALAPRLNAAGRLGQVLCAAELVLERDTARAETLALALCDMNRRRQQLEADIWEQAAGMLAGQTPSGPIVLAGEGWHQGVIGIVASRLAEAYGVPVVMISLDGDRGKGSCRSYGSFNLFDALSACGEHLSAFGGHALAAGLNIERKDIEPFREALNAYYANNMPGAEMEFSLDLAVDSPELLTLAAVDSLQILEPWGSGNPRPSLCLLDAGLAAVIPIGGGKHLRLRLEKFGRVYDCVWFSHRAEELGLREGERVDAAFYPQVSEFRGRRSVQLVLLDLRRTDLPGRCRRILESGRAEGGRLTRMELGRLWRSLERQTPLRIALEDLGRIEPRLHPVQIALGLRVLSEVGLAALRMGEQDIHIMLTAGAGKADLLQSPSWRAYHR